jgi:tetratricopeptide (TPR) repeat protein
LTRDEAAQQKQRAVDMLNSGGDPRVAYRLLSAALEVLPDAHNLVLLAEIEVANPLWRQRALDHLKQAIDLEPRLTAAWLGLGNYWSVRGQPEKQRRCLERILAYEPGNRDVRQALDLLR